MLLGNLGLAKPHGSEIWTWTLAAHFRELGFDITILTNEIGQFAFDYLNDCEIVTSIKGRKFDCGIVNHSRLLNDRSNICAQKLLLVCHGWKYDNERPPADFHQTFKHVAVSWESARHWSRVLKQPFHIVVNPTRDQWFNMPIADGELRTIIYANHRHQIPDGLERALSRRGIQFVRIKRGLTQTQIMNLYNDAQLVIGTGRYIYEAMSAGRRVIVADSKSTLGYVTKLNYSNLMRYNMTCRNPLAKKQNWEQLLSRYELADPSSMREIARREHHVSIIGQKFIDLLESK